MPVFYTRDEFIRQKVDSERQIRRRVIPLGIIYAIRLAIIPCGIQAAYLTWNTGSHIPVFCGLVFCALLFVISFPVERNNKRRFVELALKCPSCLSCLVFEDETLKTGRCYHCGERIFDLV
jgi:hypothetical protein